MAEKTLFIAIPAHERNIDVMLAAELIQSVNDLWMTGWGMRTRYQIGDPFINRARNTLLAEFLRSDAWKLLFIDDDVVPERGAIKRIISWEEDIVAGVYRSRKDPEQYKLNYKKEPRALDSRALLEVDDVPMGFTCISRKAAQAVVDANQDRIYKEPECEEAWDVFTMGFCKEDSKAKYGGWRGEDYWFCLRARAAGIKIWVDPWIKFQHVGKKSFQGCLGTWQMKKSIEEEKGDGGECEARSAKQVQVEQPCPPASPSGSISGLPLGALEAMDSVLAKSKRDLLNGSRPAV